MTSVWDEPRKSPRGRPMLRGNRRLGLGCMYILVGQCQGILSQAKIDVGMVTLKLKASVRIQHWARTQAGLR